MKRETTEDMVKAEEGGGVGPETDGAHQAPTGLTVTPDGGGVESTPQETHRASFPLPKRL